MCFCAVYSGTLKRKISPGVHGVDRCRCLGSVFHVVRPATSRPDDHQSSAAVVIILYAL